jgi:hypothetical protein
MGADARDAIGTGSDASIADAAIDAPDSYAPCPTCCDPIKQDDCGSGEACYPADPHLSDPAGRMTSCATSGIGSDGAYCGTVTPDTRDNSRCAPGYMCGPAATANDGNEWACTKMCWSDEDCTPAHPTCARPAPLTYFYCQ